jgi:hypothetical protein
MYFTANPGGVNHIWRQRFPDGQPEQITGGPTEEEGMAMARQTAATCASTRLFNSDAALPQLAFASAVSFFSRIPRRSVLTLP